MTFRKVLQVGSQLGGIVSALFGLVVTILPANSDQLGGIYIGFAVVLAIGIGGCVIGQRILASGDKITSTSKVQLCIERMVVLLDRGHAIGERFRADNDVEAIARDAPPWTDEVATYLADSFGKEVAAQFKNAPAYIHVLPQRDFIGNGYWQQVEGKVRALGRILTAVREQRVSVL